MPNPSIQIHPSTTSDISPRDFVHIRRGSHKVIQRTTSNTETPEGKPKLKGETTTSEKKETKATESLPKEEI